MHRVKRFLFRSGPYLFLAAMLLITLYMDRFVALNVLDGDASDHLVRAWIMSKQNALIPAGYAFSTELGCVNDYLVFSLLFRLTGSWPFVRIAGTFLVQGMYLLSFLFLMKTARVKRGTAVFCGALLLVPFSAAYARIMLYHVYYTVYMSECFLMLAFTLQLFRGEGSRGKKILYSVLLGLLWFVCGLNGIRHIVLLGAPLGLTIFWYFCRRLKNETRLPEKHELLRLPEVRLLGLFVFSLLCFLPGYLINSRLLSRCFDWQIQGATSFSGSIPDGFLLNMLNNFLHSIGIRISRAPLMGLRGISLVCALLLSGCGFGLSAALCREKPEGMPRAVLCALPVFTLLSTVLIFLFQDQKPPEEWYFVPVLCMLFPMLGVELDRFRQSGTNLLRRLIAVGMAVCLLFQGAYTIRFMRTKGHSDLDEWSGLYFHAMNATEEVAPVISWLDDHGETAVLVPYWYGSVLTEMSGGRYLPAIYDYYSAEMPLTYFRWATYTEPWDKENRPETLVAMILTEDHDLMAADHPSAELLETQGVWQLWRMNTDEIDWKD